MPCVVLPVEGNTRALQQKWTRATKQRFQESSHAFSMSCAFLSFFFNLSNLENTFPVNPAL